MELYVHVLCSEVEYDSMRFKDGLNLMCMIFNHFSYASYADNSRDIVKARDKKETLLRKVTDECEGIRRFQIVNLSVELYTKFSKVPSLSFFVLSPY